VIGSVLNRFDPSKARYYSHAGRYAYHYHYRHEDSGMDEGSNAKGRPAAARTPDNVWP
jgi:hypothetical protein